MSLMIGSDCRGDEQTRTARSQGVSRCGASGRAGAGDFERLLMRVCTVLAGARWQDVGDEVDRILSEMLGFFSVDQAGLVQLLAGNSQGYLRHIAGQPAMPERFNCGVWFPWMFGRTVGACKAVSISHPDELPAEAQADRASMRTFGYTALLHIPLHLQGEVRFVLTAARTGLRPAPWTEQCAARLAALGEMLALAVSRAEALGSLSASRHELRDTLQASHLGSWEWDIGADKLDLSDEAKHILGTDVPDLARLLDLIEPADRGRVERSIEGACAQPGKRIKTSYAIRTPGGEARAIQQWHEALFPGKRTGRVAATVLDVSALRNTEQELVQLREDQWHSVRVAQASLLVASLAHELCQPLSAILNNAQAGLRFLSNSDLSREDMRDILTDIVASNKRASEVLGALRAMLLRRHTTRITFDAVDAVKDVLALVRSELMSQTIEVDTTLAGGCYLNADKAQIEQVLLNLVMNSIDAMRGVRGKRCLHLSLSAGESSEVNLAVEDTGRGIPSEELPRVFDAFWTTKRKGLGIGLPVCRAIVESYGGRIWCENNTAGGVTFRLTLPSAEQQ